MNDTQFFKQLSETVGVSGKEDAVRDLILNEIRDHVTSLRVDALGNITAVKKGKGRGRPRLMLDAHMDEIGLMATGIEGDGLIRFTNIGGVDERILPGLRVKVGDNAIPGVITWTPIHKNRDQSAVALKNLRIDIGASTRDEAGGKVKAGDRIAFDSYFAEIGATMLRGKAFDNRVGCALLVDVLKGGPYAVDVLAAFTVQEEIGLRGARVAAKILNPDVALALEGTTANDLPNPVAEADDTLGVNPTCRLGAGPALTVMDRSMIAHPKVLSFVRTTAAAQGIPVQIKTMIGGGTDAGAIHTSGAGVPSGVISVPCRYIHSPTAYLNREDYAATLRLLQAILTDLKWEHLKD